MVVPLVTLNVTVTLEPAQTGVPETVTLEILCALIFRLPNNNIVDRNKIKLILQENPLERLLKFEVFVWVRKLVFMP